MSKTERIKAEQGYKLNANTCRTCKHFTSQEVLMKGAFSEWVQEKNKRCGIGGFAVKVTATCLRWEEK